MTKFTTKRQLTLVLLLCLGLVACAPQASIEVFITPTLSASQVADIDEGQGAAPPAEAQTVSNLALQPANSDFAQQHPTVTWLGPIIGPNYTLPATTVPPTATPSPTVEGQPSPTVAPTIEGQPTAVTTPTGNEGIAPADMPTLNPELMGVQFDINLTQSEWDDNNRSLSDLGVRWIKVQIPWKDMQPNNADEVGDFFNRTKLYLQDAHLRQYRILLSVAKAPGWARSNLDQDGPPDDPQAFARFLTMMLNEFAGHVDAIEVWNEPNLLREWQGQLPFNGSSYMELFNAAYIAIRAHSPSITIVTAGLAPTGDSAGSIDDRTFLNQMYAAGLGNYRDISVGIHPYSWANPPEATCCGTAGYDDNPHFFFADNIRDYRQIMVNGGHSDLQMWATEFGWATWDGFPGQPDPDSQWMLRNSRWDQANDTIHAFQMGQQMPFMGPMFLWNLNFAQVDGLIENADERIAYSLVLPGTGGVIDVDSTNRTERPLYWMIHDAVRPDESLPRYD
jgi:polysaccharide biosynthesis protein PslG